ncbi:FG-GAP repeat protein [Waterburya agarophytonicola K14]|uniref:FG-GAP repeat protein n=1 Tax=Waterburya agarophytonicola KI4 TaxID=2874699 RepID=A0A964FE30_9CYAN|nr:calcium-binding protein [Waterburya agarophytonicola]MCC0175422.1 FG-GAP repeat protein [Waterburya agarophytonicola KI4]
MFPQQFNLSDLASFNGGDGTEGFIIKGIDGGDNLGISVNSGGDVNGDGIDDLIIGASGIYDPDSASNPSGKSYIVFGKSTFQAEINLSNIVNGDGTEGFVINGIDRGDFAGYSVSGIGDLNGDRLDDIIIGARSADGKDNSSQSAGESYVVYGGNNLGEKINLSDIASGDGSDGFVVYGVGNGDVLGTSVSSAGDVNGDDIDDIIIGAKFADGNSNDDVDLGVTYVVFGDHNLAGEINLTNLASGDGRDGFVIYGADPYDFSGTSVNGAGDINNDGIEDIIIGSRRGSGIDNKTDYSGESYVIFGGNAIGATVNLGDIISGDGSRGLAIYGVDDYDFSGTSVSGIGDVNGDRIDDIIISAESGGGKNNNTDYSGESYIIYGSNDLGANINLSNIVSGDGSNGFVLYGVDEYDFSGTSVSSAGDINNDGKNDIIIGVPSADGNNNSTEDSGESYVVFGGDALGAEINLSDIVGGDGSSGFALYGINADDFLGTSVSSAGDLNGDGIDDIIIGANGVDLNNDAQDAGASYVVFGKLDPNSITDPVPSGDRNLSGTGAGDRLESGAGNDITRGGKGNDAIDGDNGKDRLFGDDGADDLNGGKDDDFLQGGDSNDLVKGGKGDDIVYGDGGDDTLLGGSGADTLYGDAGEDIIDGGTGRDRMLGGTDADIFVIRPGDLNNIIYDFEDTKDLIRLDAGLTFGDLTITDNGLNTGTSISQTSTGDLLVSAIDIDEINITSADFI